jgi:hypothetical protein
MLACAILCTGPQRHFREYLRTTNCLIAWRQSEAVQSLVFWEHNLGLVLDLRYTACELGQGGSSCNSEKQPVQIHFVHLFQACDVVGVSFCLV